MATAQLVEDIESEKKTRENCMVKVIEELITNPQKLIAKELETLGQRIKKQEEKLEKIIEKIEKLERVMESKEEGGGFLDKLF